MDPRRVVPPGDRTLPNSFCSFRHPPGRLRTGRCVYAVAGGKITSKKWEYADRAMALLQKAARTGFKDTAHMKKYTNLDLLRERDDFKMPIAAVEAKAETPPARIEKPS